MNFLASTKKKSFGWHHFDALCLGKEFSENPFHAIPSEDLWQ